MRFAIGLFLVLAGCGGVDPLTFAVCTPGESSPCACTDGASGAQVCNDDATSYASCSCTATKIADAGAVLACAPGYSICGVPDAGAPTEGLPGMYVPTDAPVCVDLQADTSNCGACGVKCPDVPCFGGAGCVRGTCVPPSACKSTATCTCPQGGE